MTRRQLLRSAAALAGGALLHRYAPGSDLAAWQAAPNRAAGIAQMEKMRATTGAQPIVVQKITDAVTLLSGPGGNVLVLHGADGKLIVDGFVQPAWPALEKILASLGKGSLTGMIDTHWHFDHADNNANARAAGATILAADATRKRMAESHDLLGAHFPATPSEGLPTKTFPATQKVSLNGEGLSLEVVPPAHTDTDVFVHFTKANVLHMGDVFFNGTYPFIDASTGGHVNGMIAGADRALKIADARTKIVPGHGPMTDRAGLTKHRDMLVTVRDRVQKLKLSGRTLTDVQAAKPTAEFDAVMGKGMMSPDAFVALVYQTVK